MSEKLDVYSRVTNKIIADLERGNLTWLQPWQAGHQAGPVSRPLRAAGKAYRGVNVLMLWAAAMEKAASIAIWAASVLPMPVMRWRNLSRKLAQLFYAPILAGSVGNFV
jgi:N-terminal domain of anti-restriction factor ArdC